MLDWLVIWGVSQAAVFVFRPVLEELAKDVTKDAAKSYVGKCFKSVFSGLHRDPLTRATGLALKELLEQIESELLDADLDSDQLQDWIDGVRRFTKRGEVRATIASLFLDPDYKLDPATFADAWQKIEGAGNLPKEFSWQRVSKRFARKVAEIRQTPGALKDTFDSLASNRMSEDIGELVGLPPDVNLDAYREALTERFRNLSFESLDTSGANYSGVRLWSVFVPQSVRECHEYQPQLLELPKEHLQRLLEKGELDAEELAEAEKHQEARRREYLSQPLRPVLEVADDPAIQRTVILGDPGSGKSSLLRFLALRWANIEDPNLRYTQPLPLLIELRDYNRWECQKGKSFLKYLNDAQTWHRLNQRTMDHLLKQPDRVVLMLDGLDEIFDPAQRKLVINDIHRFSNKYPNTPVVVTSRVVGYEPQRLRDADFRHFMLQDLDKQQIGSFLDKWHDVTFDNKEDAELKRERLRGAIHDSKPIAMLAGNPLLLTMMAILNRHQALPRNRVDLYKQASHVLLHQWDTERALEDYPELRGEVDLRAKTAILRRIAYAMQTGPRGLAGNIIDGEALTKLIEEYLHDELHFEMSRAAAAAVVRQMRERNFILCFLGADSYAFVHRTFLEYYCAADFVHRLEHEQSMTIDDLVGLFDDHCRDGDWREVLRLICGQIDEQFVGRIVEHLATRTDLGQWNSMVPLQELALAMYCLSEVRSRARLERAGTRLLDLLLDFMQSATNSTENLSFFDDDLVPASAALGYSWPGLDSARLFPEDLFECFGPVGTQVWPTLVAELVSDRSLFVRFLTHRYSGQNLRPYGMVFRSFAIRALAEKWPNENTRMLLEERAVKDEHEDPRRAALEALAEKWPDENTRTLLIERAVKDGHTNTRSIALEALAEKWPDEEATRKLLAERVGIDGAAASLHGGQHSRFGRIVFTEDLDGVGPYLDPAKPISREHIKRAAKEADVPADKIDETVRSLSEHMGWDITKGAAG